MKKKAFMLILPLVFILFMPSAKCGDNTIERWVLIVGGFDYSSQFLFDTYYCYYVMRDLGINPDTHIRYYYDIMQNEIEVGMFDGESTKANVQGAITNWLHNNSDEDDIIFIYFGCHGGGFNNTFNATTGNFILNGGRIDVSGDEGNEHQCPTNGTWFGVDECLWLYGEIGSQQLYWDDELKTDLTSLTYGKLIVMFQSCVTRNNTCFSGGFIDDLSAPNRIIITSSNETRASYGDLDGDVLSELSEGFFDALYGYDTDVDLGGVHTHEPVDADYDGNMHVSIEEAFRYAYEHDDARWVIGHYYDSDGNPIDESPWLDDNGNGFPTFKDGQDILDCSDGTLAANIWLDGYHLIFSNIRYRWGRV